MPEMDGLTACRAIIEALGDDAPPIVALTASTSEEERQRCTDAGMAAFMTKPVRAAQMSLLQETVEASRRARAARQPRGPPRASRCVPCVRARLAGSDAMRCCCTAALMAC
jgi:CheY-like chemotaxis protein